MANVLITPIRAKRIPRAASALEERLWILLIGSQRFPTGKFFPRPEREYVFHETRKWRFDFAWPQFKIAVECEGGAWTGGRHTRGAGFVADCEKYNAAAMRGWLVFRFTGNMINSRTAIDVLNEVIPES